MRVSDILAALQTRRSERQLISALLFNPVGEMRQGFFAFFAQFIAVKGKCSCCAHLNYSESQRKRDRAERRRAQEGAGQ